MVVGCEVYLINFHQICCRNINWTRMLETFTCLRRFLKNIDDQCLFWLKTPPKKWCKMVLTVFLWILTVTLPGKNENR